MPRGTVSRVLGGERHVSDGARTAIEQAIAEIGYTPNIGGILLGSNPALSARDDQLVCLIVDSDRDSTCVARYLNGGFVDGAIAVSARVDDQIVRAMERLRIPAAFVGHPSGITAAWAGIGNRGSACAVTKRLMANRRKRIGMPRRLRPRALRSRAGPERPRVSYSRRRSSGAVPPERARHLRGLAR